MDTQQHLERGKWLAAFMGADEFNIVCKEIASTITANNLDATPEVLKDLFNYIAEEVAISRI